MKCQVEEMWRKKHRFSCYTVLLGADGRIMLK